MEIDYYQAAREFVKSKVQEVRQAKNRGYVRYLQVGACDGEFMDFAFYATTKQDHGILVEPNETAFKLLQKNKQDYSNCTLLNCAILPERFVGHNLQWKNQVDHSGIPFGSGFLELGLKDVAPGTVQTLTIKELLAQHIQEPVDCLFVDIEGLDADFVIEYTDYQQPDFILFESWNYTSYYLDAWNIDLTLRADCLANLESKGYSIEQFKDDMCAFK